MVFRRDFTITGGAMNDSKEEVDSRLREAMLRIDGVDEILKYYKNFINLLK